METVLIFLQRTAISADGVQTVEIAAVEREQTVARYEAQGYRRCSAAEFCAAWQQRDRLEVIRQTAAPRVAYWTTSAGQQDNEIETAPKGARIYPQL